MTSSAGRSGPSPTITNRADGTNLESSFATDKNNPGPFSGARRPTKPITLDSNSRIIFRKRVGRGGVIDVDFSHRCWELYVPNDANDGGVFLPMFWVELYLYCVSVIHEKSLHMQNIQL